MSGVYATKAAAILFPVCAADSSGRTGVYRYTSSTLNQSVALPTAMRRNFLTFKAVGCSAQVAVSRNAAQTLVNNQASTVGSESAASGTTCADGAVIEGVLLKTASHLNFICSNATGYVEFYLSEVLGEQGIG